MLEPRQAQTELCVLEDQTMPHGHARDTKYPSRMNGGAITIAKHQVRRPEAKLAQVLRRSDEEAWQHAWPGDAAHHRLRLRKIFEHAPGFATAEDPDPIALTQLGEAGPRPTGVSLAPTVYEVSDLLHAVSLCR